MTLPLNWRQTLTNAESILRGYPNFEDVDEPGIFEQVANDLAALRDGAQSLSDEQIREIAENFRGFNARISRTDSLVSFGRAVRDRCLPVASLISLAQDVAKRNLEEINGHADLLRVVQFVADDLKRTAGIVRERNDEFALPPEYFDGAADLLKKAISGLRSADPPASKPKGEIG